ncbi:MAG: GntR family transcriptional regulator [Clostridiales bacterium]|nr:GntR family transcriptional regulator [Clostridiales bacterium]
MVQVDFNSKTPTYEQIQNQIKKLILQKAIRSEEKIPSIRELAYNITINPNTVRKAYSNLEKEGIIETVIGKGTYVTLKAAEIIKETEYIQLKNEIIRLIQKSNSLGITVEEFIVILNNIILEKWTYNG